MKRRRGPWSGHRVLPADGVLGSCLAALTAVIAIAVAVLISIAMAIVAIVAVVAIVVAVALSWARSVREDSGAAMLLAPGLLV